MWRGRESLPTLLCESVKVLKANVPISPATGRPMTAHEAQFSAEWAESLDSLEGVPDIFEPHVEPPPTGVWHWIFESFTWFGVVLPGL